MMNCDHPNAEALDDDARKANEGRIINLLGQQFPGYPLDELLEAAYSPIFQFAKCPDCREMLVKMA